MLPVVMRGEQGQIDQRVGADLGLSCSCIDPVEEAGVTRGCCPSLRSPTATTTTTMTTISSARIPRLSVLRTIRSPV
jgi:hypothetical protein